MADDANSTATGYMCRIDFEYELGNALGGAKIYLSAEDLIVNHPSAEECGIVEVKVTLVNVINPGEVL